MKNYRPLVFFGLLLLEIFCGRAVYAGGYVNSYTYKNSSGEIVDLATKMNVKMVGTGQADVYRVGNDKVECLIFSNGTSGLWNPITGALKTNPGRSCNLPPGSKFVIYPGPNSFPDEPLVFSKSVPVLNTIDIPGAAGWAACPCLVSAYFTIAYPNHKTFSFFMVNRLKNPKIYRGACSYHLSKLVRSKFKMEYSTQTFLVGYGFDKNKILIHSLYFTGFKKNVFLLITLDHLDHIVSFQDNDTFIIPANLVYPSIAASPENTVAQYHELVNAVNDYLKTKAERSHTSHKH